MLLYMLCYALYAITAVQVAIRLFTCSYSLYFFQFSGRM